MAEKATSSSPEEAGDLPVQPSSVSLSSAELPQGQSECPACKLLLRYPQRVTCCQRRFCEECIEKLLKDGEPCPKCKEADFSALPDDSDERLGLKSTNKDEGELASDLEEHPNSKPSPESQLDGCPQDCGENVQRQEMDNRINQLTGVDCDYLAFGCEVRPAREDLPTHINESVADHTAMLAKSMRKEEKTKAQFMRKVEENAKVQAGLLVNNAILQLKEQNSQQSSDIDSLKDDNKELKERISKNEMRLQHFQHLCCVLTIALAIAAVGIGLASYHGDANLDGQTNNTGSEMKDLIMKLEKKLHDIEKEINPKLEDKDSLKSKRKKTADSLAQVEREVATEKSERKKTADSLARVEREVATEKKERKKVTDTLAQNLTEVEREVATEKSERKKMADSLVRVEREVATEKSERKKMADSLVRVEREVATGKSERKDVIDTLAQVKRVVATEEREKEKIRGSLNVLNEKISTRDTLDSTTSTTSEKNATTDDNIIKRIQTRQSAVMRHLQMIPHEVVLPFEFTMHEFQEYKRENKIWHSLPFYTHSHGYTLCIDVRAFRTHRNISVYAYLMLGAFDEDLNWPFRGNVTIELINQAESSRLNPVAFVSSRKKSHVRSFDFAETRDSRVNRRVTMSKRAKSGKVIHHFIAHSALDYDAVKGTQYLKDDSLKFRISKVTNIL